jgi:hypothetical protein
MPVEFKTVRLPKAWPSNASLIPRGYRYSGRAIRVSDRSRVQDIPLYGVRNTYGYRYLFIALLRDERPRPFLDFIRESTTFVSTSLASPMDSDSMRFAPDAEPLLLPIREEVARLREKLFQSSQALPMKGAPILNPDLTKGGYFAKTVRFIGTTAVFTVWYRDPENPSYEGQRSCSFSYDISDGRLTFNRKLDGASRNYIYGYTDRLRDLAEAATPPSSFFSAAALEKFNSYLVAKLFATR